MKSSRILLSLAACSALGGCKSKKDDSSPPPPSSAELEPAADSLADIRNAADTVLDELAALEQEKDVTCWTSFRQLDWYIAEKSYGEFATLAKVQAIKALVREAWARASAKAKGHLVTSADLAAALSLPEVDLGDDLESGLGEFANGIGIKNYKDYQKTAEHWRIVLAVLMDEIVETGGKPGLKGLEPEALHALANDATTLSLLLLKRSGQAADEGKSELIEAEHVKSAYQAIAEEFGLKADKRLRAPLADAISTRHLRPLTRRLIEGKAKALQSFNKGSAQITEDLNRVARMPIDEAAVQLLQRDLQSFIYFVGSGFTPMRADNFLSDGSYAETAMERKSYVDEVHAQNVVMQIFPHRLLPNGDALVRFEPNPGPMMDLKLEPFELRILDHEMNGVRDSAIHWIAARVVWDDKPFAMDPFAAEYVTEVASMMMATWMRRGEMIAKEMGKERIDAEVAKRVRSKSYVMVPPADPEAKAWSEEQAKAKAALLAAYPKQLFKDVTKSSGLPTTMPAFDDKGERVAVDGQKPPTAFDLQTIMGGGIAVGDVNGDGYADLFLTGESMGRLYLNKGAKGPGSFVDSTEAWGLPASLEDGHGALFFDAEGDGDQDLLVLRSKQPSALYIQDGGRFTDKSAELGFKPGRGAHVAHVFDYDRDGDLDVYVGFYGSHEAHLAEGKIRSLPALDGRNGSPNQLYQNDGSGHFVEVSREAGLDDVGWALAVNSFDYDGDGLLDLYVANDFGANSMFRNKGDGSFEAVHDQLGVADRGSGMNVDVTDINGDGRWDFYVTNIDMFSKNIKVIFPRDESTIDISESLTRAFQYLSGNKFYVSTEEGGYEAREQSLFEPLDRGWGWDASFFDYDNDGDDDAYLTNGWVQRSYAGGQKNQMYLNGEGYYYLSHPESAESFGGNTRSAAAVDIDNDGDVDLVANNFRQPPRVFANQYKGKNHWVRVALKGKGKNPAALGATVLFKAGDRTTMRNHSGGRGYLSQGSPFVSAGLGAATTVDVEVRWPDGSTSKHAGLTADTLHEISQP